MISRDDLGLVPWKSTGWSTDFNFFFTEWGWTLYGITRHNNTNTIPIIFRDQSGGILGLKPDSGRNTRGRVKTSYMSSGRAAEWAEYFTDEHMKIVQGNRVFDPGMTWADFMKLLDQNFDLRRTKDKARTDLSVLKMKQGELEQYILDFNSLAG